MSALDVEQRGWTDKREYPLHANPTFVKSTSSSPIGQLPSKWPILATNLVDEGALNQKISEAKAERDLFWISHERTQLNFQREETEKLMSKMHKEMERLHMANRELERRLYVERTGNEEMEQLEKELSNERQMNADLRRELGLAVKRSARLAQMLEKSTNIHKEQMAQNESKTAELQEQIRRLNGLLLSKTKSRSIGPTMVRFGPVRRSQSGDSRGVTLVDGHRIRTQSEMISGSAFGAAVEMGQGLGIDAAEKNRPPNRRLLPMMFHSTGGGKNSTEKEGTK